MDPSAPPRVLAPLYQENVAGRNLSLRHELRELRRHRNLLGELVRHDLTSRYRGSSLGALWTMLHPLAMMALFLMIFSVVFRFRIRDYKFYFLPAYLTWMFLSQTVMNAMIRVTWNGALIKRLPLPRSIFTLASTLSGAANFVLSLTLLLVAMLLFNGRLPPSALFLPLSLLLMAVFVLGLALALTSLSVLFADVQELVQASLPALMYLTPIIYPVSIVEPRYRRWIEASPISAMVELVRLPLYDGVLPSAALIGRGAAMAALSLTGGWLIFRRVAPVFDAHV